MLIDVKLGVKVALRMLQEGGQTTRFTRKYVNPCKLVKALKWFFL